MKIKHDLVGIDPSVEVTTDPWRVLIRAEEVDYQNGPGQPSGTACRLGMTPADSMKLLALLKAVQQRYGWPDAPPPDLAVQLPPHNKRN